MPKMKSNSGAKKRFRSSSTGKLKRERAFGNHILIKKNAARRRRLRTSALVEKVDQGRINRLLPYGPTR